MYGLFRFAVILVCLDSLDLFVVVHLKSPPCVCARVYVRYSPDIGTGLVICNVVYFDVMQCNANVIYVVTGVRLTCVRGAHNGGGATGLWSFSGGVALTLGCLPWLLASLPASKPPCVFTYPGVVASRACDWLF